MPPTVRPLLGRAQVHGSGVERQHGYEWPARFELQTHNVHVGTVRALKHILDMAALADTVSLRHAGTGPLALSIMVPSDVEGGRGVYNAMWAAFSRRRQGRLTRLALAEPEIGSLLKIPDELDFLGLGCGTVCADELSLWGGRWQIWSSELAAPLGAVFYSGKHHPPSCPSGSADPDTQRLLTLYAVLATVAAAAEVRVSTVLDERAIEDIRSAAPAVHPDYRAMFTALADRWAACWLRSAPLDMRSPAPAPPPLPAWQPLPLSSLVTGEE